MAKKPKIKIELTRTDRLFEILGWTSLISIWVLTIDNYPELPDTIPIHYSATMQADGFGGKGNLLTLPFIATALFFGLTILNRFPHIFNYPTTITADNALRHYRNATRSVRYLKVIIVVIFGLISYQTIRHANGQAEGPGSWFLPFTLVLIFIPIINFVVRSFKTTKK